MFHVKPPGLRKMIDKTDQPERAWYLIYTKPKAEQIASSNLERQGFTIYLPKISIERRLKKRYVTQINPYFPRYLFINLSCTTDDWSPIRSTYGVSSIVRFGSFPIQVPDSLIDMLKGNENDHGLQDFEAKKPKKGDKIRILEGAMAGCEGIFEAETKNDRVIILLKIAGNYTKVNITRHNLQLA